MGLPENSDVEVRIDSVFPREKWHRGLREFFDWMADESGFDVKDMTSEFTQWVADNRPLLFRSILTIREGIETASDLTFLQLAEIIEKGRSFYATVQQLRPQCEKQERQKIQ